MQPVDSFPSTQQPTTGAHPKQHEFIPQYHNILNSNSKIQLNIIKNSFLYSQKKY